ncbi:MAG: permease [Desulfonatronovibrio sp.]
MSTVIETGQFFLFLFGELVLLFVGISFLVGLLLEYIPPETMKRVLGQGRHPVLANSLGAGFGALTPFCSCSTIPILLGLIKGGAPFGASMSFLIASPLLNPIILILILSLMGLKTTIIYFAVIFPVAVLAGSCWQGMGLAADVKNVRIVSDGSSECECSIAHNTTGARFRKALNGALAIFRQVLPWLVLGSAIGALIYGFIPQEWIVKLAGEHNPLAIPVAAIIGIPMYIRTETILPISSVLLDQGMGMGAVMALIIGGAGASIPEVSLLNAIFKKRLVLVFVLTILLVAVLTGSIFAIV